MKSELIVVDKGQDTWCPAVWPSAAKNKFELVLDDFRGEETHRAQQNRCLWLGKTTAQNGGEAIKYKEDSGNERDGLARRARHPSEVWAAGKIMDPDRNWFVEPGY